MKRWLSVILVLTLLFTVSAAWAEGTDDSAGDDQADNLVVTQHKTTIKGKEISYTATAGTMAMSNDLGDYDMFFIAYTLDGVEDPSTRPITFAYNGGPGAAALYVNLGLMGPNRVALDDEGMVAGVPAGTVPNENSLLDMTDLVFIDPVGTGYSRASGDTDEHVFYGYSEDICSVGDFVLQYVNRNQRWASPKYLAGESYGTTRTAGLCDYLMSQYHMNVNGLMMVSSVNDFSAIKPEQGNDLPYVAALPTFAAIAQYHGMTADQYKDMALEDYMDEVRAFAGGEYWSALFQGARLTAEEIDALADKISAYIGLDKSVILENNLRIDFETFCRKLLVDQNLYVGRIDGRYKGPAVSGSIGMGDADPSSTGVVEAFTSAIYDMIARDLNFQSDLSYNPLDGSITASWQYSEYMNSYLRQEETIQDCMQRNKFLKVWVICGYYDLATPFYGAEWTYAHVFLNDDFKDNLSFTYYPAGHMFYLHQPSLQQFREDAEAWFGFEG